MENLRGIDSFVKTVDAGSIAAAARLLGISSAAASQNITRLENQLGARLLTRTTRSLRLTEAGELYYSKVRHIVQPRKHINVIAHRRHAYLRIKGNTIARKAPMGPVLHAWEILLRVVMWSVASWRCYLNPARPPV